VGRCLNISYSLYEMFRRGWFDWRAVGSPLFYWKCEWPKETVVKLA